MCDAGDTIASRPRNPSPLPILYPMPRWVLVAGSSGVRRDDAERGYLPNQHAVQGPQPSWAVVASTA